MTELSCLSPGFRNQLKRIVLGDVSNQGATRAHRKEESVKPVASSQPEETSSKESTDSVLQYVVCCGGSSPICCVRPDQSLFDLFTIVWNVFHQLNGLPINFLANNGAFSWILLENSTLRKYEVVNGGFNSLTSMAFEPISTALISCNMIGSNLIFLFCGHQVQLKLGWKIRASRLAKECPKSIFPPTINKLSLNPHQPPAYYRAVDELYPNLSFKLFETKDDPRQPNKVFLFQPGKRRHHAFVKSSNEHVAWIPENLHTLEKLFEGLEQVFSYPLDPRGDQMPNSCTVFPNPVHMSGYGMNRLKKVKEIFNGYLVAKEVPASKQGYFKEAFPKTNEACTSIFAERRGWIRYKDGILQVCRGRSRTVPASNTLSFQIPSSCYEPELGSVISEVEHKFSSLQELLCAVESMW